MSNKHSKCPTCGADPTVVTIREGLSLGYRVFCSNSIKNKCGYRGSSTYSNRKLAYKSWDRWAEELSNGVS